MTSFSSLNPETGEIISEFPIMGKEEVESAVSRAKVAAADWQALGFAGRKKILLAWNKIIVNQISEIAELISKESGKPLSDAKLEASLAMAHLGWAARNAKKYLGTERRNPGLLMFNMGAQVAHKPYGVVGVIGPWNYPMFTPMGSITYALAAGNTVVFKPSEFTPTVGKWIVDSFAKVAPNKDILLLITGDGSTGNYLTQSDVGKIAFTGSTATAKKVAENCARNMTPVVLECGGKDPVLVDKDADLDLAAEYTIWSAMSNAGQSCIGAERVYVHEAVADRFINKVAVQAKTLTPGKNYGAMTMPKQLDVIRRHIADAIQSGGTAIVGGVESVGERFVSPVVLVDVPEFSSAMTEETFGPTIAINRVPDMDTAIELSNSSNYGLGASVWSKSKSENIAKKLNCGMVAINAAFSYAAVPTMPFGGVKDSGYGRIHGPEGLLEFTYAQTMVSTKFKLPIHFTSFKRNQFADNLVIKLSKFLNGRA